MLCGHNGTASKASAIAHALTHTKPAPHVFCALQASTSNTEQARHSALEDATRLRAELAATTAERNSLSAEAARLRAELEQCRREELGQGTGGCSEEGLGAQPVHSLLLFLRSLPLTHRRPSSG